MLGIDWVEKQNHPNEAAYNSSLTQSPEPPHMEFHNLVLQQLLAVTI